ncbi:predicted protein [Histoplasma capsulatum H143]|uniref:Uncharacterized protein n=1 Tax=Ajellomyces capsulatus (strain H143) TaxID=544712 RepID=C6HKM4_AJECH|nr:predicted protein [Histoplasma capsulatum H143]
MEVVGTCQIGLDRSYFASILALHVTLEDDGGIVHEETCLFMHHTRRTDGLRLPDIVYRVLSKRVRSRHIPANTAGSVHDNSVDVLQLSVTVTSMWTVSSGFYPEDASMALPFQDHRTIELVRLMGHIYSEKIMSGMQGE